MMRMIKLASKYRLIEKFFIMAIVSITLVLSGCDNSEKSQQVKHFIQNAKLQKSKPLEPLPEIKIVAPIKYSLSHLRNPFARSKNNGSANRAPDLNRPRGPLENYALDSLKMIGLMETNNQKWAIISAPDGMVYSVTLGEYVGQNYGKIIDINPKKVTITESFQVGGEWQERKSALQLSTEDDQSKTNSPTKNK